MARKFYVTGALERSQVTWYWIEDKANLDGQGPRRVRE